MCFPQHELFIGILQAGQAQKSETNCCGRLGRRFLLDWTKQRVTANEDCTKTIGMEPWGNLTGSKWPRPSAGIVSCPMHETTRANYGGKRIDCNRRKITRQGHCSHALGPSQVRESKQALNSHDNSMKLHIKWIIQGNN